MPMMLTIQHPGIREAIRDLPPGLWVARPDPDEPPLLIVKATKEIILTAIERGGFAFYDVLPVLLPLRRRVRGDHA